MSSSLFEACRSYLQAQAAAAPPRRSKAWKPAALPAVTISREAGAGALTVAQAVVDLLGKEQAHPVRWTIFDRNLVQQVLEDHELPATIQKFMPEDVKFDLVDAVEELLGLHPASWTLVEQTTDTILRLASAGHVVLIGRGGNVITAHLKNVFHVRLVAPVEFRRQHLQEVLHLTEREADLYLKFHDRARARYVRKNLGADIADPLGYHVTINTVATGFAAAAQIIAQGVRTLNLEP